MLRLLADENFNGDIVRGLLFHRPNLDLVRIPDVGLAGEDDRAMLAWAAENDRIILSHDRATLPDFAFARVAAGERMPGVFILNSRFAIGDAIQEILLLAECSEHSEWVGRVIHLPI
jgi:predicted nuclease of predicted toxin-antitoxin system